ncbi:MAG TPA: DUF1697 domain-containing protein [Acidimicrobiales bacterium]
MVSSAKSRPRRANSPSSYVALLRGINVGGKGKLSMQELRELFESLGFEDVRTVIQSGNVVFRAASRPSSSGLETAIAERFQITSAVVLRSSSELAKAVHNNPFGDVDRKYLHVGFMGQALSDPELAALDLGRFAPERLSAVGSEVYFCLPLGMGTSKLASHVARRIGASMTVRNWNTVTTLAKLAAT